MSVNSIPTIPHSRYLTNRVAEVKNESEFTINKVGEETPNLKISSQSNAILEELSSEYDIRKATFDELTEISRKLYETGEITFREHAILVFDYGRAAENLKRDCPNVPKDYTMYETYANTNGERDWITEFEARASKDFKYGQLAAYQGKTKILSVLRNLDS